MADENEGALIEAVVPPTMDTNEAEAPLRSDVADAPESLTPREGSATEESIPYQRFKGVNDELSELKQWSPYIDQLRQQYQTPAAVKSALEQQGRDAQANTQNNRLAQASAELQRQVDNGTLDLEVAQAKLDTFQAQQGFEQMSQQYTQFQNEQQFAQAQAAYPNADFQTVLQLSGAGYGDILSLAKQSHEAEAAKEQSVISRYLATKAQAPRAPEGTGGNTAPKSTVPSIDDPGFDKWFEDQIRKTVQGQ